MSTVGRVPRLPVFGAHAGNVRTQFSGSTNWRSEMPAKLERRPIRKIFSSFLSTHRGSGRTNARVLSKLEAVPSASVVPRPICIMGPWATIANASWFLATTYRPQRACYPATGDVVGPCYRLPFDPGNIFSYLSSHSATCDDHSVVGPVGLDAAPLSRWLTEALTEAE